MFEFELPEKFRRYVPLAVWLIVALVVLAIPLKIISYGFLPGDDALRHRHRVADRGFRQQDGELVATQPAGHVAFSQRVAHAAGDLA